MRARGILRFAAVLQAFLLLASLFLPGLAAAAVYTDQADYSPGSVVTISGDNSNFAPGEGYQAGETVHVDVLGPNGYTSSCDGIADANGAWSCQVTLWSTDLAVGSYSYTATGLSSGTSEFGTFTDAYATNTAVTSSLNPSNVGDTVTFTSTTTKASDNSAVNVTGDSVDWKDGNCGSGTPIVTGVNVDSSGKSTLTTSALVAGSHTVTACYKGVGTGANAPGNSNGFVTQVVNKFDTTTATAVEPSASLDLNTAVHDTATVSHTSGTASVTGSVTFTLFNNGTCTPGSGNPGSNVLQSDTVAYGNPSPSYTLAGGTYSYQVVYGGDANYGGSTSGCEPFTVNPSATNGITTEVIDNHNALVDATHPVALGTNVQDTATLTGQVGSFSFDHSATVTYEYFASADCTGAHIDQSVTVGSDGSVPGSNVNKYPAGTHSYLAIYNGNNNYGSATGSCEPFTVSQAGSTTATVIRDAGNAAISSPIAAGTVVHDTATVGTQVANFVISGTVTFTLYDNATCDGNVIQSDTKTMSGGTVPSSGTYAATNGWRSYQAVYSGDSNYTGSSAPCEPFQVTSPDSTAPVVTVWTDAADSIDSGTGWYNITTSGSDGVLVHVSASDTSGVANITCTDNGTTTVLDTATNPDAFVLLDGTHSISCVATDGVGNTGASAGSTAMPVDYQVDEAAPANVVTTLDRSADHNGWYNHAVDWTTSGDDPTSGIASCDSGTYSGPDGTGLTVSGSCTDNAGNTSAAAASDPFDYDATAPEITITTPADAGSYVLNASVLADFACTDATSGLDTCVGTAVDGSAIDTASVGPKTFTVDAEDQAGNQASLTNNYSVLYSTGPCLGSAGHQILQPINANGTSVFKRGSTVPAKFRVCDANGVSIGTPGVVTSFKQIGYVSSVSSTPNEDVVSTTPDNAFRWDPTAQQWIFNINTKGMTAGVTYLFRITLNDGSSIDFQFGLK